MDIERVEQRIREAVASQQAKGIKLGTGDSGAFPVDGKWIPSGTYACAIGCVLLELNPPWPPHQEEDAAAALLHVSKEWVHSFICGFDCEPHNAWYEYDPNSDAYKLGEKLRGEFLT